MHEAGGHAGLAAGIFYFLTHQRHLALIELGRGPSADHEKEKGKNHRHRGKPYPVALERPYPELPVAPEDIEQYAGTVNVSFSRYIDVGIVQMHLKTLLLVTIIYHMARLLQIAMPQTFYVRLSRLRNSACPSISMLNLKLAL
ncbi:hypothetical protein SDC9_173123 [bioreactor metagenome]|uniref:Uncharacterized protein n=1 Tax=bioreactor metagenome TaxID=1076179 RepID=A0A645GIS3_9ZZZZ